METARMVQLDPGSSAIALEVAHPDCNSWRAQTSEGTSARFRKPYSAKNSAAAEAQFAPSETAVTTWRSSLARTSPAA